MATLTDEQSKIAEEYVKKYIGIGRSTIETNGLVDQETAERIIHKIYKAFGYNELREVVLCNSPFECVVKAKERGATQFNFGYGAHDADSVAWYQFNKNVLGNEIGGKEEACSETIGLGWYLTFEHVCFVSQLPEFYRFDEIDCGTHIGRNLHCETGPAVKFLDGYEMYFWNGVRLNDEYKEIVTASDDRLMKWIGKESNTEMKRIMLEKLGFEKYIKLSGATPLDSDKFGDLYQINLGEGAEAAKVLHVVNHTQNPDGSYDEYMIPVPPNMEFSRQAVAWTAGIDEGWENYDPEVES